ncbi:hypothetical protein BD779DRAFT_1384103, partial [Infundibulicybe gibba]
LELPVIPFLPLNNTFDPTSQASWQMLWPRIGDWLVNVIVETDSYEWHWGAEAFWMVYVAANPQFPGGEWEAWDSRIALEGTFIEQWL